MKIKFVTVGKGRVAWADEAARDYGRRIGRYAPFAEERIRPKTPEHEGARLLRQIGPRARLVVLDQRGDDLSSEALAGLLQETRDAGVPELIFAIGGPDGHPPAVRRGAWRTIRLSGMVLNHQVARVVMLEQIYRAWTILNNEPYHRP